MAYVITDPCEAVCDTACVEACPVDAIHGPHPVEEMPERARVAAEAGTRLQLFIDPEACICCAACESACPVDAIFDEPDVPRAWTASIERNAAFFRLRP